MTYFTNLVILYLISQLYSCGTKQPAPTNNSPTIKNTVIPRVDSLKNFIVLPKAQFSQRNSQLICTYQKNLDKALFKLDRSKSINKYTNEFYYKKAKSNLLKIIKRIILKNDEEKKKVTLQKQIISTDIYLTTKRLKKAKPSSTVLREKKDLLKHKNTLKDLTIVESYLSVSNKIFKNMKFCLSLYRNPKRICGKNNAALSKFAHKIQDKLIQHGEKYCQDNKMLFWLEQDDYYKSYNIYKNLYYIVTKKNIPPTINNNKAVIEFKQKLVATLVANKTLENKVQSYKQLCKEQKPTIDLKNELLFIKQQQLKAQQTKNGMNILKIVSAIILEQALLYSNNKLDNKNLEKYLSNIAHLTAGANINNFKKNYQAVISKIHKNNYLQITLNDIPKILLFFILNELRKTPFNNLVVINHNNRLIPGFISVKNNKLVLNAIQISSSKSSIINLGKTALLTQANNVMDSKQFLVTYLFRKELTNIKQISTQLLKTIRTYQIKASNNYNLIMKTREIN